MKKLTLLVVGKQKAEFISAQKEYLKRLSPFYNLNLIEIEQSSEVNKMKEEDILIYKENEEKRIMKYLNNEYVILLDLKGQEIDSYEFANLLDSKTDLVFIIGGAYGVSENIFKRANYKLKLSDLTFTHLIARIILLEQIYRGVKINNNANYHK
ncbi:MAG: 23S rRNA (pseudouridine(1915)-N(3))-methyltransferase RlmH [Bacillales bacterium]|jgi:23S rRNA (pseudouridine1915-N3)-methyltransferase|nr:23S rRNA (pseudouridine(1915)-N(3))-methyltransferase RlmH [Bacillales bacterium]